MTDSIIIILGSFFLYKGWKKGFFQSFLGPFCLIISAFLAFFYYLKKQNILITLLIILLAPLILSFILSGIIQLKNKALKKKPELSKLSKFLGSFVYFCSRGISIIILIMAIMFIPDKNNKIKMIQEDIIKSKTYTFLNPFIKIPIDNMHKLMSLSSEDAQSIVAIKQIQSIQKYQDIINHQTFKNFIADEDVIRDIKNKDIGKLLINPKMKSLLEDKNLMKDLLQIHKELLRTDLNNSLIDIKFEEDHLPMQN